jgi:hypothetical protein
MHIDVPPHLLPGRLVWLFRTSSVLRVDGRDVSWIEAHTVFHVQVLLGLDNVPRVTVVLCGRLDAFYPAEEVYATEAAALAARAQHDQRELARQETARRLVATPQ